MDAEFWKLDRFFDLFFSYLRGTIAINIATFSVCSEIYFDGYKVGSDYSGYPFPDATCI